MNLIPYQTSSLESALVVFDIKFDNNRTLFVPGQKIEGFIVLTLKETVKLSVLKLKFNGIISTYISKNNEG